MRSKLFLPYAFLLWLIPAMIILSGAQHTSALDVAIVTTEGTSLDIAGAVEAGIEAVYNGRIHARVSTLTIDVSDFETRQINYGIQLSTVPFHDPALVRGLKEATNADVIVFVTDQDMSRWDRGDASFLAGEADPETGSLVVSSARTIGLDWQARLGAIAAHEMGHLLGYTHGFGGGIMEYREAGNDILNGSTRLNWKDRAELSLRIPLAKWYYDGAPHAAGGYGLAFINALFQTLIFLPPVLVLSRLLRLPEKRSTLLLTPLLVLFPLHLRSWAWALAFPLVALCLIQGMARYKAAFGREYSIGEDKGAGKDAALLLAVSILTVAPFFVLQFHNAEWATGNLPHSMLVAVPAGMAAAFSWAVWSKLTEKKVDGYVAAHTIALLSFGAILAVEPWAVPALAAAALAFLKRSSVL